MYAHGDILRNPSALATRCNLLVAVLAYTGGMSYATAMAPANVVASVPMVPGDFSWASVAGEEVLSNAVKTDSAAEVAGDPAHFLFVDTATSTVLREVGENTAGSAQVGGGVTFPNCPLILAQPVAV